MVGPNIAITSPSSTSYTAIVEAALDVARAAEQVSQRRSNSRRRLSRQNTAATGFPHEEEGMMASGMLESFHSDRTGGSTTDAEDGGGTAGRSTDRMSLSAGNILDRGRSRTKPMQDLSPAAVLEEREEFGDIAPLPEDLKEWRSKSRSLSLVRGQSGRGKGRRAAGVAFMSLSLLVHFTHGPGHNTTGSARRSLGGGGAGRILWSRQWHTPTLYPIRHPSPLVTFHHPPNASTANNTTITDSYHTTHFPDDESDEGPPSLQRIVGRVSAWTCTTLYLTSRLPQIWKNVSVAN
jgi:hypothetical protein